MTDPRDRSDLVITSHMHRVLSHPGLHWAAAPDHQRPGVGSVHHRRVFNQTLAQLRLISMITIRKGQYNYCIHQSNQFHKNVSQKVAMITAEWSIVEFQVIIFHFQPARKSPQWTHSEPRRKRTEVCPLAGLQTLVNTIISEIFSRY